MDSWALPYARETQASIRCSALQSFYHMSSSFPLFYISSSFIIDSKRTEGPSLLPIRRLVMNAATPYMLGNKFLCMIQRSRKRRNRVEIKLIDHEFRILGFLMSYSWITFIEKLFPWFSTKGKRCASPFLGTHSGNHYFTVFEVI